MAWDVDTGRTYLEIPDNSKDQMIQDTMDRVMAEVCAKLQRTILFESGVIQLLSPVLQTVNLPRYPNVVINSIVDTNDNAVSNYEVDATTGIIAFSVAPVDSIKIDFDGGYNAMPLDLEWALWEIVGFAWSNMNTDTGGPTIGGGAAVTQGSGDVSRVTLQDFGTLTYDVGSTTTDTSDSGAASQAADWGWLSPWASTLQIYRSEQGVGLGIA